MSVTFQLGGSTWRAESWLADLRVVGSDERFGVSQAGPMGEARSGQWPLPLNGSDGW